MRRKTVVIPQNEEKTMNALTLLASPCAPSLGMGRKPGLDKAAATMYAGFTAMAIQSRNAS
jgi:hypothetical protein